MQWLLDTAADWGRNIGIWLLLLVGLAILSIPLNFLLNALAVISVDRIKLAGRVLKNLKSVPGGARLVSDGRAVSLCYREGGREKLALVATKMLPWKQGSRTVRDYSAALGRRRKIWIGLAVLEFVALAAGAVAVILPKLSQPGGLARLTLDDPWVALVVCLLLLLPFHTFVPFYLWLMPGVGGGELVSSAYEDTVQEAVDAVAEAFDDQENKALAERHAPSEEGPLVAFLREHVAEVEAMQLEIVALDPSNATEDHLARADRLIAQARDFDAALPSARTLLSTPVVMKWRVLSLLGREAEIIPLAVELETALKFDAGETQSTTDLLASLRQRLAVLRGG